MRFVVRIARIGIDRNNRWIVGGKILAGEGFHEPLLDFVFFRPTVAHALADFLERSSNNGIDAVARCEVRLDLGVGPGRFELCHQIGGTDNVLAQAPQ